MIIFINVNGWMEGRSREDHSIIGGNFYDYDDDHADDCDDDDDDDHNINNDDHYHLLTSN